MLKRAVLTCVPNTQCHLQFPDVTLLYDAMMSLVTLLVMHMWQVT